MIALKEIGTGAERGWPERELWASVALRVLADLVLLDTRTRQEAERWIGRAPSRDFRQVCALAGLDSGAAHRVFRDLAALPLEARAARLPEQITQYAGRPWP